MSLHEPTIPQELGDAPLEAEVSLTYREGIRDALRDSMRADPDIVLLGEDIGVPGGVFKCTDELFGEFGKDRVIDTPIAEYGFTEVALGLATRGFRPVVEIMFADFLPLASSAIAVDIPRWRMITGGVTDVPITIKATGGIGAHFGAQHSMTYESWFQGMPGLAIAVPATPLSAYGAFRAAVASNNPVVVIDHKMLYQSKQQVRPADLVASEIGRAVTLRSGNDVTIVASLACVAKAIEAADRLEDAGTSAEVIDIAWVKPLDVTSIEASVRRTGRLVIALEDYFAGSWAATLIAELAMRGIPWTTPPAVLHLPHDLPVPFAPTVEMAMVPSVEAIVDAASPSLTASSQTGKAQPCARKS